MNKKPQLPDKIFGLDRALLTLFLPPFGLVLIFLISLNLVLIPRVDEIKNVNKKTNEVNDSTKSLNEQIKYLMSIDQEELQRDADYLDNAVLRDKKSYLLVGIIRGVAEKFDYQIESFSLTPGELKAVDSTKVLGSGDIIKMPINLSLYGPKSRSLEFVSALEKTLPILFIDKFETKVNGDIMNFDLVVSSYYIKNETNMDASKVTLSELTLTDEEVALVEKISSFNKIKDNQSAGTAEFQQYQRDNPFSL